MRKPHPDVLPTDEDLRDRITDVLENSTNRTGKMLLPDLACRTGLSQQHILELIHDCPLRGFRVDGPLVRLRNTKDA